MNIRLGSAKGSRVGAVLLSPWTPIGRRVVARTIFMVSKEVRVTMEVPKGRFSAPERIPSDYKMPGGGMQRTATGNIPVHREAE